MDFMPPTIRQKKVQYRAIRQLVEQGTLTAWDIQKLGSTDARKILTRLNRMGLISHNTWEINPASGAKFKRHHWSGVSPFFK